MKVTHDISALILVVRVKHVALSIVRHSELQSSFGSKKARRTKYWLLVSVTFITEITEFHSDLFTFFFFPWFCHVMLIKVANMFYIQRNVTIK